MVKRVSKKQGKWRAAGHLTKADAPTLPYQQKKAKKCGKIQKHPCHLHLNVSARALKIRANGNKF